MCVKRVVRLIIRAFKFAWGLTRFFWGLPVLLFVKSWSAVTFIFKRLTKKSKKVLTFEGMEAGGNALNVLRHKILVEYFASNNNFINPYQRYVEEAMFHGYASLEAFLHDIPPWILDYCTEHGFRVGPPGFNQQPPIEVGMRFVVIAEPELHGALADRVVVIEGQHQKSLAKLRLDIIYKGWLSSLASFTVGYLPCLRGLLAPDMYEEFHTHDIMLEKEYLRNLLRQAPMISVAPGRSEDNFTNLIRLKDPLYPGLPFNSLQYRRPPPTLNFPEDYGYENGNGNGGRGHLLRSPSTSSSTLVSAPLTHQKPKKKKTNSTPPSAPPQTSGTSGNVQNGHAGNQEQHQSTKRSSSVSPQPSRSTKRIQQQQDQQAQRLAKHDNKDLLPLSPIGMMKGIDGAHNSCYIDALLFSMFYSSTIFDSILTTKQGDSEAARMTRSLLRDNVIQPLRTKYYCPSDNVWELRQELSKSNQLVLGSFMDVEELLYMLLQDVLHEKDFMRYIMPGDEDPITDMMHLMQVDNIDPSKIITVQRNLEMSFELSEKMRLVSVPVPGFFLGMPRSNRELVHYEAVIPNLELQIAHLMTIEVCSGCSEMEATWEEMFQDESSSIARFCGTCVRNVTTTSSTKLVSRERMKLLAVMCIGGVHFVAFVRWDHLAGSKWLFFDSMAGGGPEVEDVKNFEQWLVNLALNPELLQEPFGKTKRKQKPPEKVTRVCTDGHICIYEPVYWNSS